MRRLWVRWVGLFVFVAVLGTVFVNLGGWQLDRLAQRRDRNAATRTNEAAPVKPADEVFTRPVNELDQWQRVAARGTFDAGHQFIVRYRTVGEDDGYQVVTPLQTSSGVILVDRGLIPRVTGTGTPTVAPPPPSGEVTVTGYVRRNEVGRRNAVTPVDGQMRLINSDAVGAVLPYPVANGYLSLSTVDPPQEGDFRVIPLPELSEGPHFWYAVQWFMFTGIAIFGIVVFIRGDLRERRAAQGKVAAPVG